LRGHHWCVSFRNHGSNRPCSSRTLECDNGLLSSEWNPLCPSTSDTFWYEWENVDFWLFTVWEFNSADCQGGELTSCGNSGRYIAANTTVDFQIGSTGALNNIDMEVIVGISVESWLP
jgi:hypothetical protein